MNDGLIYENIIEEWVKFTNSNDANMYENLTDGQNDLLTVIKEEQDQIVNGINLTWLSDFYRLEFTFTPTHLVNKKPLFNKMIDTYFDI